MQLIEFFFHRRLSLATKNFKIEINTSISDLTKTNNEKVNYLESNLIRGATDLLEMNTLVTNQITVVTNTLEIT